MKLGIIGKPQSGKTTVFNAASGQQETVGDYSKAVHRAVIKVPDRRIDDLAEIVKPKKRTYAEIEFLDAAGFTGKGKDATTFDLTPDLELMDAFIMVVDAFSPDATPDQDIHDLIDEMILSDQVKIENSIEKREKKIKLTGDKSGLKEMELLKRCLEYLESEKPLIDLELEESESRILRCFSFLTSKPILVVFNVAEETLGKRVDILKEHARFVVPDKRDIAVLCGKIEMELESLEEDEQKLFLDELGIDAPITEKVIKKSYALLGLISFITAGDKDVHAWTVKRGTTAHRAAGVIHTDLERGFIRAEVSSFDDYMEYGSEAAMKAAGKIRVEGKDYIVRDGDVIYFRFNV